MFIVKAATNYHTITTSLLANQTFLSFQATYDMYGTDEAAIINVLAYRSNDQRHIIAARFKQMFGMSLEAQLTKELSGWFLQVRLLYYVRNSIKCRMDRPAITTVYFSILF